MHVRTVPLLPALLLAATLAAAQTTSPSPPSTATPQPAAATPEMAADLTAYGEMLGQIQALAQRTTSDLGKLRVDKWKADSATKQQAQSNTAALQRNLAAALPEMIQKAQAAPQDLAPNFKLYRNLNVLYDVLSVTAESAGAFGPKDQYEPLANDASQLNQLRRSLADRLDWLAGVKDGQITQLRQQLVTAQEAAKPKEKTEASSSSTPTKKKSASKKKKSSTPPPTVEQ